MISNVPSLIERLSGLHGGFGAIAEFGVGFDLHGCSSKRCGRFTLAWCGLNGRDDIFCADELA